MHAARCAQCRCAKGRTQRVRPPCVLAVLHIMPPGMPLLRILAAHTPRSQPASMLSIRKSAGAGRGGSAPTWPQPRIPSQQHGRRTQHVGRRPSWRPASQTPPPSLPVPGLPCPVLSSRARSLPELLTMFFLFQPGQTLPKPQALQPAAVLQDAQVGSAARARAFSLWGCPGARHGYV